MTTTVVRSPLLVLDCDQHVMDERFPIGPPGPDRQVVPETASRVRIMRRIATARLRFHGLEALIDPAQLVVSELVANAMIHSGAAEVQVVMFTREGCLNIVVIDGMPGEATLTPPGVTSESGRGLYLVQAVTAEYGGDWGTSDAGAQTWCRFPVISLSEQPQ
ncbi:histidine kinase-like protein [Streptomyces sp. Ag109_O5-1]|uniref:ATP-binding protein n=1 Tax=Streptomyces sp. Ag109_O5-1 TaxID=1938851 RepID=UPI000FBBEC81|nr:ATP-binding protein [Streptomyces sp. Ag109_O5-1]RPE39087.1 histidine kinase-like protein [Streptomyces sp. Ag109_O5-1]